MGSGEHAVYVLKVSYNGRRWSVQRRYSEFDEVDKALVRAFGKDPDVKLPALPSKVWVGGLSKENLDKRKNDLELYLQKMVAQSKLVHECAELRAFLEIPPTSARRPTQQGARGTKPSTRDPSLKLNGEKPDLNGARSQGRLRQASHSHLNGNHGQNGFQAHAVQRGVVPTPAQMATEAEKTMKFHFKKR
eukprot:CAMPEP_0202829758 /NCGR_PEP_ID=MMETSP1389-20130828/15727_1 /ASSEMBLY_ACC=CAM_ASM_000865 /TAXON_ID=302021 /ORGANISM="Rhodomonas sp., Strain CCMP768" /LENGTH=189 /DNA_ID=CAMNT_0049503351 /DNA_START=69 /DNA_END=635 /DNA_ORIENTATION=+